VNIHAGFDETSILLRQKYISTSIPGQLNVFDFYDPAKHTEISIKRARNAMTPFPGTIPIQTGHLPLPDQYADVVFNILAAHEIRDESERVTFFKEIHRILKPGGKVVVTEHLRDLPNLLAYNIGFFHFHSKITWLQTFYAADFDVETTIKITPFITTFILTKHATAS
jgi:SAM-dependent methyltransferase